MEYWYGTVDRSDQFFKYNRGVDCQMPLILSQSEFLTLFCLEDKNSCTSNPSSNFNYVSVRVTHVTVITKRLKSLRKINVRGIVCCYQHTCQMGTAQSKNQNQHKNMQA